MKDHHLKSLSQVIKDLKRQGYKADFMYRDGKLEDMESGKSYPAEQLTILDEFRFEGQTNPDDMSILYAIKTSSGTKGTISTPYGSNANVDLDQFLEGASWLA